MKNLIIIGVVIVVFGLGLFAVFSLNSKKQANPSTPAISASPTETPLGGDRDEHGCIPSAGYSWCEPKNKCLKIWEEGCYKSVGEEIQYLLAKKYSKSVDEVKVTITKQNDFYAGGSVLFGKGGPGEGGMFLAKKTDNVWEVVFDGNGSVDCNKMRQVYGFPDEILKPNFCG